LSEKRRGHGPQRCEILNSFNLFGGLPMSTEIYFYAVAVGAGLLAYGWHHFLKPDAHLTR